jgi:large subunit ribosomal protein L21
MFAVVEIAGTQVEVSPNAVLDVPHLQGEPGDKLEFSNILLVAEGENTKVGNPYIEGTVVAEIVEHFRDDKVLVFKKKRRKGYRKLNGHRQGYTKVEIKDINIK